MQAVKSNVTTYFGILKTLITAAFHKKVKDTLLKASSLFKLPKVKYALHHFFKPCSSLAYLFVEKNWI